MRHLQTSAETTLWNVLRNKSTGYKFRRQHPIDMFIIDFYGDWHFIPKQDEYDKARTEYLEELGYTVIRFTNNDVRYHILAVTDEIMRTVESRIAELKNKK